MTEKQIYTHDMKLYSIPSYLIKFVIMITFYDRIHN